MVKKTIKVEYNSTLHLHSIIRKLLVSIEDRIALLNTKDDAVIDQQKKTHELLFGNKLSIAGNLAIMADMLVKMNSKMPENVITSPEETNSYSFSEQDIKLIQNFIQKVKNEEAAESSAS